MIPDVIIVLSFHAFSPSPNYPSASLTGLIKRNFETRTGAAVAQCTSTWKTWIHVQLSPVWVTGGVESQSINHILFAKMKSYTQCKNKYGRLQEKLQSSSYWSPVVTIWTHAVLIYHVHTHTRTQSKKKGIRTKFLQCKRISHCSRARLNIRSDRLHDFRRPENSLSKFLSRQTERYTLYWT